MNYIWSSFFMMILAIPLHQTWASGSSGLPGLQSDTSLVHRTDSLRIFCYGYANFFSIFTRMQDAYRDYSYSHRNVTFAPYPDPGLVNRNAEQPFLFLAMEMHRKDIVGRLNWNLVHSFTGMDENWSKNLLFRMPPSLEMLKYTRHGEFSVTAGNCTGKTWMSTLTLSGQSLVTHPFDRLPWDWFQTPYDKYESIYTLQDNPLKVIGLNATQGFLFSANQLFKRLTVKFFYGRTNFTSTPIQVLQKLPSYVLAGKVAYALTNHSLSFNTYYNNQVSSVRTPFRQSSIYSLEYKGNFFKRFLFASEIATQVTSLNRNSTAFSGDINYHTFNKNNYLSLGAFYIPYEFVSLDNAILNTNVNHSISGLPNDHQYNLTLYINPMQMPGILSNNRKGVFAKVVSNKRKFRFEFEHGYSREITHVHDSLTFFHLTNAFTRSRFTPWLQGSGPYNRIGGRYRFTTETVGIQSGSNTLHFFSAQYRTKYKTNLFQKEWLLLFTPGYGNAFDRTLFQPLLFSWNADMTSIYRIHQKISILFFGSLQGTRSKSVEPLQLHQQSRAAGMGTDIEIAKNAGFYFRYKRFVHEDKNYQKDLFKGDEVTMEVKVFF